MKIERLESTATHIKLKLENGVSIDLDVNPDYIRLHFSGINGGIVATPFIHDTELQHLELANYVDIGFNPSKK